MTAAGRKTRRLAALALPLALAVAFGSGPAAAQADQGATYPSRNILLVVPFAAGGPPDVIARVLAHSMSETLGKSIVVENRPGASTTIGTVSVVRAPPDGHTLLASSLSMVVVPYVMAKPGFDPIADLKPISLTGISPQTLVVGNALPVRSAIELAAYAKGQPHEIKAAHTGIGTSTHLGLLALMQAGGFQTLQVPYRGAAQAISDIVAGHISMLMTAPSTSIGLAREGKVRVFGVTGDKRLSALPEVPTLKEQGLHLASLDNGVWFGLSAPAGTPDPIVRKLNAAVRSALVDPKVAETLNKNDTIAMPSTPEAFAGLIEEQISVWREVLRRAGVKPE